MLYWVFCDHRLDKLCGRIAVLIEGIWLPQNAYRGFIDVIYSELSVVRYFEADGCLT